MSKFPDSEYLKYKGHFPKYGNVFLAMFIDLFVVNILAFIVIKLYAAIFGGILDKYTLSYIGFALYVLCLFYVPVLSALSQTVGQKVAGIKIRMADGNNMSVLTGIHRWLRSIFSPFGYGNKRVPGFDRKCGTVLLSK